MRTLLTVMLAVILGWGGLIACCLLGRPELGLIFVVLAAMDAWLTLTEKKDKR